jgi:hypothetical protein
MITARMKILLIITLALIARSSSRSVPRIRPKVYDTYSDDSENDSGEFEF